MLEPQRDGESPFDYMDRVDAEFRRVRMTIQAVRGGSFKGRKPNGDWWLVFKAAGDTQEIQSPSPVTLILTAAALRCLSCGCATSIHSKRVLELDDLKGKRHKDRKRCGGERLDGTPCECSKTEDEIATSQATREAIAKRLASRMMEREVPGWQQVSAATLFDGVRE